jgi:hypothetical protein
LSILSENGDRLFSSSTTGRLIHPNFTLRKGNFFLVTSNIFDEASAGYTLKFNKLPPDRFRETEPNDSRETANVIVDNKIRGYTSTAGDRDFFVMNYPERVRNTFEVTAPLRGQIRVSITDPPGYIVRSITVSDGQTLEFNEYVDKRAFIIVEAIEVDFESFYEINIRPLN